MHGPGFPGDNRFFEIVALISQVIGQLVLAVVAIGLVVLLVRFLLVGTRAAQLYVKAHESGHDRPAAHAPAHAPAGTAPQPIAPQPTTPPAAPGLSLIHI